MLANGPSMLFHEIRPFRFNVCLKRSHICGEWYFGVNDQLTMAGKVHGHVRAEFACFSIDRNLLLKIAIRR